jgi:cell division protein FtsL
MSARDEAKTSTPKRSASRSRRPRRGRSILFALLTGFVVVASAVIWRRSFGITQSRRIADLDRQIVQLEAERARLAGLIRDESSRSRLGPVVERLGMRVPDDRQVRILSR